ncbi:unnamed protein product, partial [Allacma fusca]
MPEVGNAIILGEAGCLEAIHSKIASILEAIRDSKETGCLFPVLFLLFFWHKSPILLAVFAVYETIRVYSCMCQVVFYIQLGFLTGDHILKLLETVR